MEDEFDKLGGNPEIIQEIKKLIRTCLQSTVHYILTVKNIARRPSSVHGDNIMNVIDKTFQCDSGNTFVILKTQDVIKLIQLARQLDNQEEKKE